MTAMDRARPGLLWRFRREHAATFRLLRFYAWTFTRSPSSMIGLVLVIAFLALAVLGPSIVPYPEDALGAMNLANPGLVLSVPARIGIAAKDGTDWLEAEYRVEAARQVAIPTDLGFGTVELNETFGRLTVAGHVAGLPIGLEGRACFEFVA